MANLQMEEPNFVAEASLALRQVYIQGDRQPKLGQQVMDGALVTPSNGFSPTDRGTTLTRENQLHG
jgi:hypothetical protein